MLHTDKQTNKQINAGKNIYLLAEVNNNKKPVGFNPPGGGRWRQGLVRVLGGGGLGTGGLGVGGTGGFGLGWKGGLGVGW